MQTRGASRAFSRALAVCWLLSLFACASGDPDELDVEGAEAPLGTRERALVLSDDFEQGALASPPWSSTGEVQVRRDAARQGERGVRLGARAALTATFDGRGRTQLKLAFSARAAGRDASSLLRVEVAVGDHASRPIAHVQSHVWTRHTVVLPRFVEERDTVRLRFVTLRGTHATRHRHRHDDLRRHGRGASEGVLLDDVAITAAVPQPDGGADAGAIDAGGLDAAAPDAAAPDAAVADADVPDAGTCASDLGCSDGNPCNGEERCDAGRCVAGSAPSCDDGEACTVDRCDPAAGCSSQPGVGLPCEEDGVCDAVGACVACVPPANTYDAIQLRIFDSPRYVCTSCHRAGGRLLDLSVANSYPALLGQTGGRADVTPGDPETSILYDRLRAKVEGTAPVLGGNPMPRGNAPAITRAELAAIAAWITAGAPRTGLVIGTEAALCVPPAPSDEASR